MSCCVHLLDFYHNIGREELYVKYLKKLSSLHEQSHNWAEAGFTIMQVNYFLLSL
jgi:dedicator of cytokinesis protein 1